MNLIEVIVGVDSSISVQGFLYAGRDLDRAARRIATGYSTASADQVPVHEDTVTLSKGGPLTASTAPAIDYAAELAAVSRAKVAAQANLRVLSSTLELDKETIDLLP